MFRSRFIFLIMVISLAAITIFPIYTTFLQNPQFTQLFRDNTIREAAYLAEKLSVLLLTAQDELSRESLSAPFIRQLERLREGSNFINLRIFTPDGEIVFSADESEIGNRNNEQYFADIVESGEVLTKEVAAGTESMDNQTFAKDAVEIYVPIKRQDRIVGVFELYYDITAQKEKLNRLVYRSYGILFGLSMVLLMAVIGASIKANRHLKERQRAEERLKTLSVSDEMTGLYNRRGFYTLAGQQKKLVDRTGRGMVLVMADLNGLKEINDTFGHEAGDQVLIDAAEVLKESFRESDIIARLGGDEFAVLLLEQPNISEDILTRRVTEQVSSINNEHKRDYSLSISIGFARYDPESGMSFDELMSAADARMYDNKREYKRQKKSR